MASVSERSSAPHAYVEAPVTRRTCPAVEELVMAVKTPVPFPCKSPVSVAAPVPPLATVRGVLSVRLFNVAAPAARTVANKLVEEAVVEKKLVEVAEVVVERVILLKILAPLQVNEAVVSISESP